MLPSTLSLTKDRLKAFVASDQLYFAINLKSCHACSASRMRVEWEHLGGPARQQTPDQYVVTGHAIK
ncbi:MAG TPA: hypothetical protein VKE41_20795 [Roseiflexaceae bacterium]|nr:hypothetical protein [Roseiflexaceae bacterium]